MYYHFHIEDDTYSRPYSAADAANRYAEVDRAALLALTPGETYTDRCGDVWSLVPGCEPQRDDRLERIATAAMIGVMTSPNQPVGLREDKIATLAVTVAKALIAELDKQA